MFRDNPLGTHGLPPAGCSNEGFMFKSNCSSTCIEANKQPTYTTVGSIYNPREVTPLQPPTRRPRARRYPQPIRSPSGETFIPFPNSLLSALPLTDPPPFSPLTTAATLQQYSPLQQNYDRAVSPTVVRETPVFTDFGMPAPSIRSGNLPSPTGFEGSDGVASEDTLASRITVKGLTNLASYPNPMQKAAQKALAKARTANVGLSRPNTPSSLPSTTPDFSKDRLPGLYGTVSAATGPPQPLKAGPPGQRQFKPTTLDAASRFFRVEDQFGQVLLNTNLYQPRSPIGLPYNFDAGIPPALDDDGAARDTDRLAQPPPHQGHHGHVSPGPHELTGLLRLATPGPADVVTEPLDETTRKTQDTLPSEKIKQYFPTGFPANYDGRYQPVADDWHTKHPTVDDGFTQETFSERISNLNRSFYAGTGGLVRNMEQIVRDHNYRCLGNKVGVIGEERERLRGSHIERLGKDGKVQPPFLSVEEVNKMNENDIAKPLINMAFATLLSYKEESQSGTSTQNAWPSGFTDAEDAWVDSTDEGNTSFFSKPKEEWLKKKQLLKNPRRGY